MKRTSICMHSRMYWVANASPFCNFFVQLWKATVNKPLEGVCLYDELRLLSCVYGSQAFSQSIGKQNKRTPLRPKSHNFFHHTNTSTKEICRRGRRYFWQQINLPRWTWSWGDSFWGWAVRMILAKHNNDSSIFIFCWLLSPLKRALFLKVLVCFRSEMWPGDLAKARSFHYRCHQ